VEHPELSFYDLIPEVHKLIEFVERHHIEVRGEGTAPNSDQMVVWDDDKQETRVTLVIRIPYNHTCWGCGETVPRPDHHYGSLGNGRHFYAKFVDGELVPYEYPKSCKTCLIEAEYKKPCARCGESVWYGE